MNIPTELDLSMDFLRNCKEYADTAEEELRNLAQRLIETGKQYAERFMGADVVTEAMARGITVNMRSGGFAGGKLIRGFYDHTIKTITTFTEGIDQIRESKAPELLGIENTTEKVREVLMWHEFFHVLEFTEIGFIGKDYTTEKKILWFHTKKPVYAVSEICANAFCKQIMGLKNSPFLIDYLYHEMSEYQQDGQIEPAATDTIDMDPSTGE